jgi:putative transposase
MARSSENVVTAIAAPRKSVSVFSKVVSFCPCHLGDDRPRGGDPPPLNWSTLKYVFGRRRRTTMLKKRHKPEEIVAKLRQVDVLTSQGKSVADAIRTIGVTEVTYYRWRQEFGGLKSDQVKRLKNLEAENARLRRAVSDLTLDKMILAEAARGNY